MSSAIPLTPEGVAPPGGHYVHAVSANGFTFVSGQLPLSKEGKPLANLDFAGQARAALQNMAAVIDSAGQTLDQVVKVTAYIVGIENWPVFNSVYAEIFGEARPARAVVPVPELHYGLLVEVDAIVAG